MTTSKNDSNVTAISKTPNAGGLVEMRTFARETASAVKLGQSAGRHLLKAAIKSTIQFPATVEAFYEEIRTDKNGLAVMVGAERNKKGDGYTVPNAIRAQVSQVLRAVNLGVDLGTEENPRSITDIRKDSSTAAEAAEAAKPVKVLTGSDAIRKTIADALSDAAAQIVATDGPTLDRLLELTAEFSAKVLAVLTEAKASEPKAEAAAAAMPEAAPMPEAAAATATVPPVKVTTKKSRRAA
jgi:hypothetical protein